MQLPPAISSLMDRINQSTFRERMLILFIGIALLWALMMNLFIFPILEEKKDLAEKRRSVMQEMAAMQVELGKAQQSLQSGVQQKDKGQEKLDNQLLVVRKELNQYKDKIIPHSQFPMVIETLLKDTANLNLMKVEILPQMNDKHNLLLSQKIKLSMNGEYKDLLLYLQRIEKVQLPIFWEALDYETKNAPKADIDITFYTIIDRCENNKGKPLCML